jgi:hypothetical protein
MLKMSGIAFATLFCLIVVAPQQAQSQTGPRKLSGDEVMKLVSDGKIEGDNGKFIFTNWLKPDGTLAGESCYSGTGCREQGRDSGTWRISGDALCLKFQRWGDGRETCRDIEALEGNKYRYIGAKYTITITR